jgi:predicted enzyme related to lactoylglutathione lyase
MEVRRLETVVQFVSDTEKAKQWYSELLGIETTPYEAPYFKFGEHAYLILAPAAQGTGRGGTAVWFEVPDADEAYRELTERGYEFNGPPFDILPGRLVNMLDPDGNIIGFIDNSKGGMPGQS